MKTQWILLFLLFCSAPIAETGCRKCYCCGDLIGTVTCVKGTDTAFAYANPGNTTWVHVQDTLNYYSKLGYTCTMKDYQPFVEGRHPACGIGDSWLKVSNNQGCIKMVGGADINYYCAN